MKDRLPLPDCICGGRSYHRIFTYHEPPQGETRFSSSYSDQYYREVWCCNICNHFISVHNMDMRVLYEYDYVKSTYGGEEGLLRTFLRIINLGPGRSDNLDRVQRVQEFAVAHLEAPAREKRSHTLLDVGSGLGVFPRGMKEAGWDCTALDNDPRLIKHAMEVVGVKGICQNFLEASSLGQYDVVTFNKVLEHVQDPVSMLAKSADNLREGGFVYLEVPDGEMAVTEGPEREEFYIEHYHILSIASLALLALHSGFSVRLMERVREPSTKFTLRAFLTLPRSGFPVD